MKKIILLLFILLIVILISLFAYKSFNPTPQLSDNAKHTWLELCNNNSECQQGVEKHYLECANSVSFEKPKSNADMAEYIALTKMEIEGCLTDNIGKAFPSS